MAGKTFFVGVAFRIGKRRFVAFVSVQDVVSICVLCSTCAMLIDVVKMGVQPRISSSCHVVTPLLINHPPWLRATCDVSDVNTGTTVWSFVSLDSCRILLRLFASLR